MEDNSQVKPDLDKDTHTSLAAIHNLEQPSLLKPVFWGLGAAILAAATWAILAIIIKWEIGYMALGAAFLVSTAVAKGAGNTKARKLQYASVALTFFSVILAQTIILAYFSLAETGEQSQIFYALLGILFSPQTWIELLYIIVSSQNPIGWFIMGLGIYYAYKLSDPNSPIRDQSSTPNVTVIGKDSGVESEPKPAIVINAMPSSKKLLKIALASVAGFIFFLVVPLTGIALLSEVENIGSTELSIIASAYLITTIWIFKKLFFAAKSKVSIH